MDFSKNLYYPIILLGIVVTILAYLYGTFRKNASEASNQSNLILRGLIDDQKQEIDALKIEVASLREKVEHYQSLEGIMHDALLEHFKNNPTIAKNLIKNVQLK